LSVLQKVSFFPNQRFDTPDARAMSAFNLNDWRFFLSGAMSDTSYILTGFDIVNFSTMFTVPGFTLKTDNVVFFHPESTTQAAGFYVFAGTEPDESVTLSPSSTNFVELDLDVSSGTPDVRAFWDQGANGGEGAEFTDSVDTVINLEINITSNISGFTPGKIPLYKVDTNASNVVTSCTDSRPLFFRLGTGGSTPDPDADFSFPALPDASHSRLETPVTATSATANNQPWQGGDKNFTNFKDWMDVVMTSIKEIKGVPYWYMVGTAGGGITGAYQNAALTVGIGGTWNHIAGSLGHLNLIGGSTIKRLGYTTDLTLTTFADIDLTTEPVLYLVIPSSDTAVTYGFGQDAATPVIPKDITAFTPISITVTTGGNYATAGGKIMLRGQEFTYTAYSTGTGLFSGVSPDPSGLAVLSDDVYAIDSGGVGYYHISDEATVPGLSGSVSEGAERVYWLGVYDGSSVIQMKNGDLELGEQIQVGDNTSLAVLTYMGSTGEADSDPDYTTASATGAKTGQSSYNSVAGENLTSRASKLTQMMADKAQDKTIEFLASGFTEIVNTTSGADQDITFTGGGTLTVPVPSSANNGTVGLTNTLTLAANEAAYVTIDRNASFNVADLSALSVVSIASIPLNESVFIFAYRLAGVDVHLWDGTHLPVGTLLTETRHQLNTNQDRNIKLVRGGVWSWDLGTSSLSFTSDAFIQIPDLLETRNEIDSASSPIVLGSDGDVAYVDINRTGAAPATLTVNTAAIGSITLNKNRLIIARRIGSAVLVGNGTILLIDGESRSLDQGPSDQHLTFTGSTNAADDSPDYTNADGGATSPTFILDGDDLELAITKLDDAVAVLTAGSLTKIVTDSTTGNVVVDGITGDVVFIP